MNSLEFTRSSALNLHDYHVFFFNLKKNKTVRFCNIKYDIFIALLKIWGGVKFAWTVAAPFEKNNTY